MSKPRSQIAVLAPQGWGVRNWVFSDFLQHLTTEADAIVFSPQADALREAVDLPHVQFAHMSVGLLGRWPQQLWNAIEFGHFYKTGTYIQRAILNRSYDDEPLRVRVRQAATRTAARTVFSRLPDSALARVEQKFYGLQREQRRMERELLRYGIDLVFSTAPLILHFERAALWAAQKLHIPTATMISSWDNLHSKGRLPIPFGHYLVWSELMRDELMAMYPGVSSDKVSVVGPAQFDFYFRRELRQDRAEFCASIGADPARPLILWSGVSPGQFPGEPELLASFCEAVRDGSVKHNPQILLRPHPIGGGARFGWVRERYPELLFTETNASDPRLLVGWTPQVEDARLLVNSVAHCDVNINHCSTMTLDCCALDRPVVNIAYDDRSAAAAREIHDCYNYDHYRCVLEQKAVRLATTRAELIDAANRYLADPALDREGRAALLRLQCGDHVGSAAEHAASCLLDLVNKRKVRAAQAA